MLPEKTERNKPIDNRHDRHVFLYRLFYQFQGMELHVQQFFSMHFQC